tara:strand:+ start:230 stop:442 length:213 start_codon:yes stop_codon:yes gene_type:complete
MKVCKFVSSESEERKKEKKLKNKKTKKQKQQSQQNQPKLCQTLPSGKKYFFNHDFLYLNVKYSRRSNISV